MSTTFNVYPSVPETPTFGQLLERANIELHRFLASINITERPTINVRIQNNYEHQPVPFELSDPLVWSEKNYAWFFVEPVPGGTDAYFKRHLNSEDRLELLNEGERAALHKGIIEKCAQQDHYWTFRRSAGQPALINLCYGLLAGSLADLTGGLVSSFDSAWDYDLMPATAEEFLSYYFVPALAIDEKNKVWAERCIQMMRDHFNPSA